MEFFNTMGGEDFVVGEEHTTTAKNEANTNKGEKPNSNVYSISTAALVKGLYLIKAITNDGKGYTKKLIVE